MSEAPARNTIPIVETEEGRAYYPWGAWGAGYLVDAATERRLEAWGPRRRLIGGLEIPVLLYFALRWLPNHPFFVIVGGGLVGVATDAAIDRCLLRHARRTKVRWRPDGPTASAPRRANRVARWGLLLAAGSVALLSLAIAVVFPSLDAWLFAVSFVFVFFWLARRALRLLRDEAGSAG